VNLATCLDNASISTALPVSIVHLLPNGLEVLANLRLSGHDQ
jgi:hypothetical protein